MQATTAVGVSAAGVSYKTGEYTARTSQGKTFTFRVIAHTAGNHCGTTPSAHCFIAVTYPHAEQSCGGSAPYDSGVYPIPNGFVSTTGHFSYHQDDPSELFKATIKGSKATGSFRTKSTTDIGNGPIACDTGTVTWAATRRG